MIKLLHIEDDYDFRKDMSFLLSSEGYHIIEAEDGEEGLRLVEEMRPDIILCDIKMPGLGGIDVLRQLRTSNDNASHIPFIILTALKDDSLLIEATRLLTDDYLVKPVSFDVLLAKMNAALKRPALYKDNRIEMPAENDMVSFRKIVEAATAAVMIKPVNRFKQIAVAAENDVPEVKLPRVRLTQMFEELLTALLGECNRGEKTSVSISHNFEENGVDIHIHNKHLAEHFLREVMKLPNLEEHFTALGAKTNVESHPATSHNRIVLKFPEVCRA